MALFKITNDDIFISYCRSDAKTYTDGLANELTKKGFSCFTDALGSDAGKEIPDSLIMKLKSCMMLVIIGSRDAGSSKAVAKEIEVFALTRGTSAIIPVDFNNNILKSDWQRFVTGLRREEEQQEALITGNPSSSIVNRIEKAFSYRKAKDRLRMYTRSAAIILGVLILGIAGAAIIANKQFKKAAVATSIADSATAKAKTQTELAKKQTEKAEAAANKAKLAEANAAEALNNKEIAEAEFKLASEKALAATDMAQMQQKIAKSLQFANESQTMLQNPKLIAASVDKAIHSIELNRSIGRHSVISDAALRSSLALLADFKQREVYPEKKLFFNTGGEIIERTSSSAMNQYYRLGEPSPFFQLKCEKDFDCALHISFSVSKDCRYIAFGSGKLVRIFNTVDGTYKDHEIHEDSEKSISLIAISPNGKYLVMALNVDQNADFIEIWDTARDTVLSLETSSASTVNSISFSENGKSLAAGCTDANSDGNLKNRAYIWNIDFNTDDFFTNSYFASPVRIEHENIGGGIAAGPDLTSFATWTDTVAIVWKHGANNNYNPVCYIPTPKAVSDIAFKPASEELLIIESENPYSAEHVGNFVETWNYRGYKETSSYFLPLPMGAEIYEGLDKIVYEGQGRTIVGANLFRRTEKVTDLSYWENKKDSGIIEKTTGFLSEAIQFSSDDLKATVTLKDSLLIWNYSVLENTIPFDTSLFTIDNLTITSDRRWISWIQKDKKGQSKGVILKLLNNKYQQISTFPIDRVVSSMKLAPEGTALFLLDEKNSLLIWDTQKKKMQKASLFEESGSVQSFKLSPKGKYISTVNGEFGDEGYELNIWNYKTFQKVASVKRLTDNFYAWSPDGTHIVASCEGNYKLLQVEQNKIMTEIENPTYLGRRAINVFAFSPSGKYFAVAIENGGVRIFETATCDEVSKVIPKGNPLSFAFSSDDSYFTAITDNVSHFETNAEEGFILITWQFLPDVLVREAKRRLNKIRAK